MEFVDYVMTAAILVAYVPVAAAIYSWFTAREKNCGKRWKELCNKIRARQRNRLLFYIEVHRSIPQEKKKNRQTVIYKGHFAKKQKKRSI